MPCGIVSACNVESKLKASSRVEEIVFALVSVACQLSGCSFMGGAVLFFSAEGAVLQAVGGITIISNALPNVSKLCGQSLGTLWAGAGGQQAGIRPGVSAGNPKSPDEGDARDQEFKGAGWRARGDTTAKPGGNLSPTSTGALTRSPLRRTRRARSKSNSRDARSIRAVDNHADGLRDCQAFSNI